jgi:hypothetical protein
LKLLFRDDFLGRLAVVVFEFLNDIGYKPSKFNRVPKDSTKDPHVLFSLPLALATCYVPR